MESPWLILGRVLRVTQAGHAVVAAPVPVEVEHAAVEEAEEAAQPQAEHAVVEEAEQAVQAQSEHAVVEEAEHGARGEAEHAAVEEAEDAAQVEHGSAGEAEAADKAAGVHLGVEAQHAVVGPPQAQLEQRVTEVDMAAAEATEPDFTISVAPPPRVTFVTAGMSSHPNPAKPDMYPYIIATGPFCLLVRFSNKPYHGTNFNDRPRASHLVVVRNFRNGANGENVATAERVPSRTRGGVPVLNNVDSVGFLCNEQERSYKIAELSLKLITGGQFLNAVLVFFRSGSRRWFQRELRVPMTLRRAWVPHGTVAVNNTVIWYDLSWGMITCDDLDGQERLDFYELPSGRVLAPLDSTANIHSRRCIALSGNFLRYVEIIVPNKNNGDAAATTTVSMWYRIVVGDEWQWCPNYSVSLEEIWNHPSYIATQLRQNAVPDLVCVSPVNPSLVYFAMEERLFGVDVPNRMVVHCESYQLVDVPRQPGRAPAASSSLGTCTKAA